jgi:hypothetical protein
VEERCGLFRRARLVDHEESGGEVDVGVVLDVALGLLDHAAGGDELRGATDGDADLGGQDYADRSGGLVEGAGAAVKVQCRHHLGAP